MGYLIREAKEADYERVNNLAYELYQHHFKNRPDIFNDSNICFGKDTFLKELKEINSTILVVVDNISQNVVGYAAFQIINKQKTLLKCKRDYLSVDDVVISKNYRKQGLATLLHQEIVKYAVKNNCSSIELDVFEFNQTALSFYKKLGYKLKNYNMELFL